MLRVTGAAGKIAWIGVDWGRTDVRVWVFDGAHNLLAEHVVEGGLEERHSVGFENALLAIVGRFLTDRQVTTVVCCGLSDEPDGVLVESLMAVPCEPVVERGLNRIETVDPRMNVVGLCGVKQIAPPDVMFTENTQIAGFLAEYPDFDGVLVLPGTHTKWVRISAGEIVSFQTFMTGEIYAFLAEHSELRYAVADAGWDDVAFEEALGAAISRPESVAAKLFGVRAGALLNKQSGSVARAQLLGFLVGLELAATRPYWLGQALAVIGAADVGEIYAKALSLQGLNAVVYDEKTMIGIGLVAAYGTLKKPG